MMGSHCKSELLVVHSLLVEVKPCGVFWGFRFVPSPYRLTGKLAEDANVNLWKMKMWKHISDFERQAEIRRKLGVHWSPSQPNSEEDEKTNSGNTFGVLASRQTQHKSNLFQWGMIEDSLYYRTDLPCLIWSRRQIPRTSLIEAKASSSLSS